MSRGASMDTISLDDWELLLPDHKSSFLVDVECSNGSHGVVVGGKDQLLLGAELVVIDMDHFGSTSSHPPPYDYCILDEEANEKLPSEDAYGHDPIAIDVYEAEEQEETTIKSVKEADQDDDVLVEAAVPDGVSQRAREEEEEEGVSKTGFSVGSLRVNGVGALCSFGVAAATFCILLLGGGGGKQQQQLHKRQGHKIQLQQMYAGDEEHYYKRNGGF
ncbi:uncharacterized protein LOC8081213 isoform X2 [Sorghum bicolor]|uniref:uncharacterized protein LOC8081213 isoform X2 n=1 Tax=Sorghum bicolor TaxID=4558 RepID=UPI000B4262AD|nr:uncharacterized protein LOC8081213 isoform X2 [Sorghum bicolor]|eukprot:XP_021313323.1 uncharacterized protein LOC8081213 isoform X2 [Sorghum bicolor]